jgi:Mn-dependent DtxR family transcriptional regulator
MALYLGGQKVKININGIAYKLHIFSNASLTNYVRLLSSEGYVLKDSNGLLLTAKESE